MRIHLLGVAGAGMAPLAGLLAAAGHEVSGSDVAFDPPMGPRLRDWHVRTMRGLEPAHLDGLDPARDVVVVGNVCRRDHPLVLEAERRGIARISMPTALREHVFGARPVVAVAGTHGKTTTTGLLASILAHAGLDPGYLIGGVPVNAIATEHPSPFRLGRATRSLTHGLSPFVIEGDEYDSAFFEKTPKVWGYAPRAAILTSIEHDHIDIYPDAASYRAAFAGLLARLPADGVLVANAGDPAVVELVASQATKARIVWYAGSDASGRVFPSGKLSGKEPPVWTASQVGVPRDGAEQPFDLFVGPTSAGRFSLGVFGAHNVSNALAAIAMASELLGVDVREAARELSSFAGVARRQERLLAASASPRGVTLYDDFAHHPTAVDATLRGLRSRHAEGRLVAVYEPRSATACRALHQAAYVEAFAPADVIVLAPLGRSTIPEAERLDLARLARDLEAAGKQVVLASSNDAVVEAVERVATAGSIVVAMSNGSFGGVTQRLKSALESPA